jgi:hypothetical protein
VIAEHPTTKVAHLELVQSRVDEPSLSVGRVVASLQLLLAVRRDARNQDHAYWYTISRGL